MKNKKGFTLIELVIVIVIVAILTIVSGILYKGHVQKAKMVEGKTLLNTIADALDVYYAEKEQYLNATNFQTTNNNLMVDARANKYFRNFKVENKTSHALITTKDTENKITMIMTLYSNSGAPTISVIDTTNN